MASLRVEIVRALKKSGMTRYRLAQMVKGKISMTAVYEYLSGENDMAGENIELLMRALDLKIQVGGQRGPRPPKRAVRTGRNRKQRDQK